MSWDALATRMRELTDLYVSMAVLGWDHRVMMPPAGVGARGRARATLATISHAKLTDPELGRLLDEALDDGLPPDRAAMVDRLAWERDRAVRVPARLAAELSEAATRGASAWEAARAADDWAAFAPSLRLILELKREEAEAIGYETESYDVHLENYERGLTAARVRVVFDEIARSLRPLIERVLSSQPSPKPLPPGPYDTGAQVAYCRDLSVRLGLDAGASRLDLSAHPFTTGIGPGDVRITTRVREDDPLPAVLATIHETGHALYEAGLPQQYAGTPLYEPASLAVHESQSRLWENHVGRSRAFWEGELPRIADALPGLRGVDAAHVWAAANRVGRSLIRVDADELTYPLHIIQRFEVELALARGEIDVDDLPAAFDDAMQRLVGVRPANFADGVLQDTHWAAGLFGYYPTYLLGSMYAAALFESMGDVDDAIRAGDFAPVLGWLRERVHRHGGVRLGEATVEHATRSAPTPGPYLRYLAAKADALA